METPQQLDWSEKRETDISFLSRANWNNKIWHNNKLACLCTGLLTHGTPLDVGLVQGGLSCSDHYILLTPWPIFLLEPPPPHLLQHMAPNASPGLSDSKLKAFVNSRFNFADSELYSASVIIFKYLHCNFHTCPETCLFFKFLKLVLWIKKEKMRSMRNVGR